MVEATWFEKQDKASSSVDRVRQSGSEKRSAARKSPKRLVLVHRINQSLFRASTLHRYGWLVSVTASSLRDDDSLVSRHLGPFGSPLVSLGCTREPGSLNPSL
jgi:hypothetical protein